MPSPENHGSCVRAETPAQEGKFLLLVSVVSVFVVSVSWLYLISAMAFWVRVFGDDSTTFGYYALFHYELTSSVVLSDSRELWQFGAVQERPVIRCPICFHYQ
jgi:hypothetical protein